MKRWRVTSSAMLGVLALAAGCAKDVQVRADDPLADIRNPRLTESRRLEAIRKAWTQAERGEVDRIAVRDELKNVAWSSGWPLKMRMEALRSLASDQTPEGVEDTHVNVVKLMLPREPDHTVTAFLAEQAEAHGWADATPALIRSLSRPWPGVADAERPEYRAIAALNPGREVTGVVEEIFLSPPEEGGVFGYSPPERVRADIWDLLARIDKDGSARQRLIERGDASRPGPIADMKASMRELHALPATGDELLWLASLHDWRDPGHRAWWEQTAAAVSGLESGKAGLLQLRHLEPIRWASERRQEWLSATRQELLGELRRRLAGRETTKRRKGEYERWRPGPERLVDWETKLSWADCLAILAIDEAVHHPLVVSTLFAQAEMDRADKTTEYGGLLRVDTVGPQAPPAIVVMYPPRPGQRQGDREFVASSDMIAQGDHTLAHYHFHAQDPRNGEYAGPSPNDLAYSARYGRSCLVLTSIATDALDVDYYQPDGVVVDLGAIRK
jgi:hypothetical protein